MVCLIHGCEDTVVVVDVVNLAFLLRFSVCLIHGHKDTIVAVVVVVVEWYPYIFNKKSFSQGIPEIRSGHPFLLPALGRTFTG